MEVSLAEARVGARLLHKAPFTHQDLHLCFAFYLQNAKFLEWAMLGSN